MHHPRYIGHQVPASVPLAALFDAIGAATNQGMAIYEMGPWGTAAERALIELLGQRLGYREGTFAGICTHGASLANLTALLTARNVALPTAWQAGMASGQAPPVLVVHQDIHYCVCRSAGILGLGSANIIKVPIDSDRRMQVGRGQFA